MISTTSYSGLLPASRKGMTGLSGVSEEGPCLTISILGIGVDERLLKNELTLHLLLSHSEHEFHYSDVDYTTL